MVDPELLQGSLPDAGDPPSLWLPTDDESEQLLWTEGSEQWVKYEASCWQTLTVILLIDISQLRVACLLLHQSYLSIWLCSLDPLLHIHSLYVLNTKLFKKDKCLTKKPRRKRKGKHFLNVFRPKGQLKHWDPRPLHSMRHLVSGLCITQNSEWQEKPKKLKQKPWLRGNEDAEAANSFSNSLSGELSCPING